MCWHQAEHTKWSGIDLCDFELRIQPIAFNSSKLFSSSSSWPHQTNEGFFLDGVWWRAACSWLREAFRFKKKVESVKNKSLHDREFKGCLSIHQTFGFQQQCFLILQLSVLWPTLCISCRYISSIIAKEWFQSWHSRTILIMNCQLWPEREVFLCALTTVLSACLTKGRSFPLLWVTVKNSCPTLAKCSCYLDPGGQAASHLCPFTS